MKSAPILVVPLLLTTALVSAQPPAAIAITPPKIPKTESLKDELNRTPAVPSSMQRRHNYSLDTQSGRAYLEPRQDDLHPDMLTPQWELFRWKSDINR